MTASQKRPAARPRWVGVPPQAPGVPWGWAGLCLLLGWGSGLFFRLRRLLEVNILDMFGFWCLVGAGLAAARFFTLLQVGDARRRLLEALQRLSPATVLVPVPRPRERGRGGAEVLVLAPGRWWVLGTCDVSAAARPRSAGRALARAAERLRAQGEALRASLAGAGIDVPAEVEAVLVLTRRPVPRPVLDRGAWQVNPEHLDDLLGGSTSRATGTGPAVSPEQLQAWWAAAAGRPGRAS